MGRAISYDLALMALLGRMRGLRQPVIMFIGLCGAALVYGDAEISPAISVMSALEGLNILAPHLQRYALPISGATQQNLRVASN